MNKQIEHLFNAAGFHKPEMERLGIEHKFEKFAELIVRECIDKTFDSEKGIGTTRWKTEVMAELKEHFGVES